jgi:hypothetical protein
MISLLPSSAAAAIATAGIPPTATLPSDAIGIIPAVRKLIETNSGKTRDLKHHYAWLPIIFWCIRIISLHVILLPPIIFWCMRIISLQVIVE